MKKTELTPSARPHGLPPPQRERQFTPACDVREQLNNILHKKNTPSKFLNLDGVTVFIARREALLS